VNAPRRDVGVIVVAAGLGTRAGDGALKQYRMIGGVPMLLRAVRPFARHPSVAAIALVLPAADAASPPDWLAPHAGELLRFVAGGAERSDSVAAGLAALPEECAVVLVHDAARPFVDRDAIDRVVAAVREGAAALAAVPLEDTLKEAGAADPSLVARTVPRARLWRAQTPQGFPRELLERAHREARSVGAVATDDAMLVERLGAPVRLVPGSARNIKVTTPDDFALAELLAAAEGPGA
jgi:2-C-methyl-D-erythritol 4-phosphate cytidylyltransferase